MSYEAEKARSDLGLFYLCFYFRGLEGTNRHLDVVLFVLVRWGQALTGIVDVDSSVARSFDLTHGEAHLSALSLRIENLRD